MSETKPDLHSGRAITAGFPPPGFELGSGHVGFGVDKLALGAGFLRVLRFLLTVIIPPTAPRSSIIQGRYSRPNSDRSTQ
jgi:hypothetical protein